jgi:hypothetical protein
MARTDQDILQDVQSLLAEPPTHGVFWPSGMWTAAEILSHLNAAQQDVVVATGAVVKLGGIFCTPHVLYQELPDDVIALIRVVWIRLSDNKPFTLHRSDIWELDAALGEGSANWRTNPGIPTYFTDGDTPTRTVQLAPAPAVPGSLVIDYLAVPAAFSGSGTPAEVPDEATVSLVWGTIKRALTKEGRAKDPARAQRAGDMVQMAHEALKLMLRGGEG